MWEAKMFISDAMNMESQTMTLNQASPAPQGVRPASVALAALFRLALLVGPLMLTVMALGQTPFVCLIVCFAVLSLWLTVDMGPFRAAGISTAAPAARQTAPSNPRNLIKAQWWNALFCRVIILFVVFHSKLNI
jgi:hypothetical protein